MLRQDLPYRKNPVIRSEAKKPPLKLLTGRPIITAETCIHGFPDAQEYRTLTITNRKTGRKEFRQVLVNMGTTCTHR